MDQSQLTFLPDGLFCLEGNNEEEITEWNCSVEYLQKPPTHGDEEDCYLSYWDISGIQRVFSPLSHSQHGFVCQTQELNALLTKEELHPLDDSHTLLKYREDAVNWMLKVQSYHNFTCLTAALGVNYFDRFIHGAWLPPDKPWIARLVAVACLSLAAKVEETHVPLLVDLKVDDTELCFEAKTIMRMEMTILSTLEWKMHPVTPLDFIDYILTQWIGLSKYQSSELRRRCELVMFFVLTDHRFSHYAPSIVATATLLHVTMAPEMEIRLSSVFRIDKLKLEGCRKLIEALFSNEHRCQLNKRKFGVVSHDPRSPDGVIDISFSVDGFSDLSTVTSASSSVSSSPEPTSKKGKAFPGDPPPDFLSSTSTASLP